MKIKKNNNLHNNIWPPQRQHIKIILKLIIVQISETLLTIKKIPLNSV